jgi:hypothetical protein
MTCIEPMVLVCEVYSFGHAFAEFTGVELRNP